MRRGEESEGEGRVGGASFLLADARTRRMLAGGWQARGRRSLADPCPLLQETLVGGRLQSARSEIQTSSLLSFAALLRPSIFQSSLPRRARPAPAPLFGSKPYSIKRPHVSLPVADLRTRTYRISFLSRLVLLTARAPFRRPDKSSVHRRQAKAKSHHRQDWVRHVKRTSLAPSAAEPQQRTSPASSYSLDDICSCHLQTAS